MRIAISRSYLVGKTTLPEALADALPQFEVVPEPYHLLEEDGHVFAEMPSIEHFELQLELSLQCIQESGTNVTSTVVHSTYPGPSSRLGTQDHVDSRTGCHKFKTRSQNST